MRVAVTGGAGYVGSVLVPYLISKDYDVTVIDNLSGRKHGLHSCVSSPRFQFEQADITDTKAIEPLIRPAHAVIHLAAIVGSPSCDAAPAVARAVNIEGTNSIVNCMSDSQLLILASTGSVYGRLEEPCTERSDVNPLTLYAQTKAIAEDAVRHHPRSIVYRFATAFGPSPSMRFDLLPHELVISAIRDSCMLLFEGHARRTFIHVRDMSLAFAHALTSADRMLGQTYNVGSETHNLTKRQLAAEVAKIIDARVIELNHRNDPDGRDYEVSYAKLRGTGYSSRYTLAEGVRGVANLVKLSPHLVRAR